MCCIVQASHQSTGKFRAVNSSYALLYVLLKDLCIMLLVSDMGFYVLYNISLNVLLVH